MHRRNDEAQLQCQMPAQRLDPRQQLAALLGIDQRHQRVAHLQAQFVQLQQTFERILLRRLGELRFAGGVPAAPVPQPASQTPSWPAAPASRHAGDQQKRKLGQPGDQARASHDPGGNPQRRLRPNKLLPKSLPSLLSEEARVTTMPPATETSSEGIMVTRPSPTVRMV